MLISNDGIRFIELKEDFRGKAYKDQAGIWTIGYGTIKYFGGGSVKEGDTISHRDASIYVEVKANQISLIMTYLLINPLMQYQFDALVSLTYNIGEEGFRHSTLLRELNLGNEVKEDYFTRWDKIHVDGLLIPSQGLRNRRLAEWELFSKGNYNATFG